MGVLLWSYYQCCSKFAEQQEELDWGCHQRCYQEVKLLQASLQDGLLKGKFKRLDGLLHSAETYSVKPLGLQVY